MVNSDLGFGVWGHLEAVTIINFIEVREEVNFRGWNIDTKCLVDSDLGIGLRGCLEAATVFDVFEVRQELYFRGWTLLSPELFVEMSPSLPLKRPEITTALKQPQRPNLRSVLLKRGQFLTHGQTEKYISFPDLKEGWNDYGLETASEAKS